MNEMEQSDALVDARYKARCEHHYAVLYKRDRDALRKAMEDACDAVEHGCKHRPKKGALAEWRCLVESTATEYFGAMAQ
jgi:hypothetical protein